MMQNEDFYSHSLHINILFDISIIFIVTYLLIFVFQFVELVVLVAFTSK